MHGIQDDQQGVSSVNIFENFTISEKVHNPADDSDSDDDNDGGLDSGLDGGLDYGQPRMVSDKCFSVSSFISFLLISLVTGETSIDQLKHF